VVSAADPPLPLISVFYTGAATFRSSSSTFILTRAEWTPLQTHFYSDNLVAPRIEPGTSGSATRIHAPIRLNNAVTNYLCTGTNVP
jgi:hypothetical protein